MRLSSGWRRLAAADDRGSIALTAAILSVALVLSAMALVQGALYFHSRNVAGSAARHGLEATRVPAGSESAGRSAALQYVDQAGGGLELSSIDVRRSDTEATVTVAGDVTSLVPGFALDVSVSVSGPVERFEP